ncbi:MAG: hypothetical protein GYA86_04440 [Firmicutes bacterium]|nr:hypothetical protein [Bacillota bacterium]
MVLKALGGTMAALALLAGGLLLLPPPEGISVGGIFTSLWLLLAGLSAAAFVRELWRLLQLRRIRSRWRKMAGKRRRPAAPVSRLTSLRERERHLD